MRAALTLVIILTATALPVPADALPVFGHRFGLTCQACHTTVPRLNDFGKAFARNGFRLPQPARSAIPVAVKVNLAYSSDTDPSGLPRAIVDEIEVLTGGSIGSHASYFIEQYALDGGTPGRTRDAWLQYNANDNTHVRAGQFTLALPVDPETQRDTEAHYLLYDQTVGANGFNFFDPHGGIDAYFFNEHGDSVHLTALTTGDLLAYGAKRIGSLTLYAYRYQGQRIISAQSDAFFRQAAGAGESIGKFELIGVLQRGKDSNADGLGTSANSSGGFAEAHYVFSPALMAVARYDRIWDELSGAQHQTVLSFVTRPAHNMRFTIEDAITDHQTLNLGLLFAY
jgi:hypothetical protein